MDIYIPDMHTEIKNTHKKVIHDSQNRYTMMVLKPVMVVKKGILYIFLIKKIIHSSKLRARQINRFKGTAMNHIKHILYKIT